MKAIVVFAVLGVGCGSVVQSALTQPDGAAEAASEKPDPPVEAGGLQEGGGDVNAPDGGAGAADADHDVDAVGTDADAGDGFESRMEAGAVEAPTPDFISGTWGFNFTPNRGNGEMDLAKVGAVVSGTYSARNIPPQGSGAAGTISGSFDGAVLRLTFGGGLAGSAEGTVSADVKIPDGTGTLGGAQVGFVAAHH